jgi:hypothetical protein
MRRAVEIAVKEISTILSIHCYLITELYGLSDCVCLHSAFVDQYYILQNLCLLVEWCFNIFTSYLALESTVLRYNGCRLLSLTYNDQELLVTYRTSSKPALNILGHSGNYMHHLLQLKNSVFFSAKCICAFPIILRKKSNNWDLRSSGILRGVVL